MVVPRAIIVAGGRVDIEITDRPQYPLCIWHMAGGLARRIGILLLLSSWRARLSAREGEGEFGGPAHGSRQV